MAALTDSEWRLRTTPSVAHKPKTLNPVAHKTQCTLPKRRVGLCARGAPLPSHTMCCNSAGQRLMLGQDCAEAATDTQSGTLSLKSTATVGGSGLRDKSVRWLSRAVHLQEQGSCQAALTLCLVSFGACCRATMSHTLRPNKQKPATQQPLTRHTHTHTE